MTPSNYILRCRYAPKRCHLGGKLSRRLLNLRDCDGRQVALGEVNMNASWKFGVDARGSGNGGRHDLNGNLLKVCVELNS